MDEINQRPIETLNLSEHTVTTLKNVGIRLIGDALQIIYDGPAAIRDIRGLGAVEVEELITALRERGLMQ